MSMLPEFVRKNGPTVPPLPRQERPPHPDAVRHMEPYIQAWAERDQLRERVSALEIDIGFKNERIRVLEESLNEAERKRDLYSFHSTAFTIRLQDLFVLAEEQAATFKRLIAEMMKQAKDEAFTPRETPAGKLPEFDGAPELAAKLAPGTIVPVASDA